MSLPTGLSPLPLAPVVKIFDYDDVLQFTYEAKNIIPAGTQDFNLTDLSVERKGNGSYDIATLFIDDFTGALINSTIEADSKIKRQWRITIELGKTSSVQKWFDGKIFDVDVQRPETADVKIILQCVGWGVILRDRITRIKRNQDKLADGISLDDADTKTRLDNLVKDMFEDQDHQLDANLPLITSITTTGICSDCMNIKVANVNEVGATYAGFISRLVGIANTDWHVDPSRDLIIRDPIAHDSGFLFSNDLLSLDVIGWPKAKLGLLKNNPVGWKDSSLDTMYSWIHGFGSFAPVIDVKEDTLPNASENVDDDWVAIPVTPTGDNIFKIAFRLVRTGTPVGHHKVLIVGDDGASRPDVDDTRRSIILTEEFLQGLGTSVPATWAEIPVTPKLPVTPNEQLYIIFPIFGDASNTFDVNYETSGGTYYISTTGANGSWGAGQTGLMNYRIYQAKRLTISVENTNMTKLLAEPREKLFPIRANLEEQAATEALISAARILGKERRVYDKVVVTAPDDVIPLAAFCRLRDKTTGLDVKANILAYKFEMHSNDPSRMGVREIELTLDDLVSR